MLDVSMASLCQGRAMAKEDSEASDMSRFLTKVCDMFTLALLRLGAKGAVLVQVSVFCWFDQCGKSSMNGSASAI
jgi:hypothetical protein